MVSALLLMSRLSAVSYTHLYGMRVDYRKKGFVLFNRNLNVLGNAEHARLEELPLELSLIHI